jgi:HK97 gp10 family phage protein
MPASGIRVTVKKNRFPALRAALPSEAARAEQDGAEAVADYARSHHPWENRTGETEASIHAEPLPTRSGWQVVAGGASLYLEFGTIHMHPFPFLGPAVQAVQSDYHARFSRVLGDALGG